MEPASVSQTLRKLLAWVTPAAPPPPPPRRRPRVRFRNRRQLPGARWRLPLAQLAAAVVLLVVLGGCDSRASAAFGGPAVLALSVFGLCLRPARAPRSAPGVADTPCSAVFAGNLTAPHAQRSRRASPPGIPRAEPPRTILDLSTVIGTWEVRP